MLREKLGSEEQGSDSYDCQGIGYLKGKRVSDSEKAWDNFQ